MTACVNEQKKKMGGGVFSSKVLRGAMAAVLAIGLMPTAAFATEAADSEASVRAVSTADDFTAGAVTAAVDNEGETVDLSKDVEFVREANVAQYVIPTQVTPEEGAAVELAKADKQTSTGATIDMVDKSNPENTFKVTYLIASTSGMDVPGIDEKVSGISNLADIHVAGTYYAYVEGVSGNYDGGYVAIKFNIVNKSLEGAQLYEVGSNPKNISDTTFVYRASEYKGGTAEGQIWVSLNGEPLENGDATVSIYEAGSDLVAAPLSGALWAGNYVARITGYGEYDGSTVNIPFTVDPFDISQANFVINDVQGNRPALADVKISTINGIDAADTGLDEYLKVSLSEGLLDGPGTYTAHIALQDDGYLSGDAATLAKFKSSIINSKDVEFNVIDANAKSAVFEYSGMAWSDAFKGGKLDIDYSQGDPALDLSRIVVKNADGDRLSADQYTVTVADENGVIVDNDSITQPGEWTLTVTVDPAECNYLVTGTATAKVTVVSGVVNSFTDVYVKYDGTVTNHVQATYDGTNVLDKIEVVVKTDDGERTLVEGTDYTVSATDKDGSEVDEIVNVLGSDYDLSISSTSWKDSNTGKWLEDTVEVTVNPLTPTYVRAAGMKTIWTDKDTSVTGLPYTGSEIVPTFEYTTDDMDEFDGVTDEDITWTALPENAYDAKYTKSEKEVTVLEATQYKVNFSADADDKVMSANFDLSNTPIWGGVSNNKNINVINPSVFQDVKLADWYAEPLSYAKVNAFANGYYGTELFGPDASITRADVVCILYNVAGQTDQKPEGSTSDRIQWASEFSDVDTTQYYAEAIGWASKSGVVNGYGDGTFAPEQNITREEFAAMLANYAKALRVYAAVSDVDSVLGGFSDGAAVTEWAQSEVAWAAQNGVMGNGGFLNAQGTITRAEAAAMAVNFAQKFDI